MVLAVLLLIASTLAAETRYAVSLTDEGGQAVGLSCPGNPQDCSSQGNLLVLAPSFSYRDGDRWRFVTNLAGVVSTQGDTHEQLLVKETYFGLSAGGLDFAVGKKILQWGTGYAFTPTGILDPPRNPIDPTDHLGLNQGREMFETDWITGRHAFSAVWASAGLLDTHLPGMRETTAFRYNTLLDGFDTSLIVSHDRGGATFTGANFTRVFGESIEVHGEFARRTASAALAGGKYTMHNGVGFICEYYSTGKGHEQYAYLRAAKSRLRELPGWKEWDLDASVVKNLHDGSHILIANVQRSVGNHLSFYARAQVPHGKKWRSEYGMIPYAALVSIGFRVQL